MVLLILSQFCMYFGFWVGKKYIESFSIYKARIHFQIFLLSSALTALLIYFLVANGFNDSAFCISVFYISILFGTVIHAPKSVGETKMSDIVRNIVRNR